MKTINKNGFTLIELIMVIIIVGILIMKCILEIDFFMVSFFIQKKFMINYL